MKPIVSCSLERNFYLDQILKSLLKMDSYKRHMLSPLLFSLFLSSYIFLLWLVKNAKEGGAREEEDVEEEEEKCSKNFPRGSCKRQFVL